eukprot:4651764-Lingulodinium_polyedra.AAC.1
MLAQLIRRWFGSAGPAGRTATGPGGPNPGAAARAATHRPGGTGGSTATFRRRGRSACVGPRP